MAAPFPYGTELREPHFGTGSDLRPFGRAMVLTAVVFGRCLVGAIVGRIGTRTGTGVCDGRAGAARLADGLAAGVATTAGWSDCKWRLRRTLRLVDTGMRPALRPLGLLPAPLSSQ